ncbi:MAG: hypothetical protein ABI578_08310, partial [Chloroflexota bacterium]
AFLLFAMGRAGEATQRAAALVELGPSDELWYSAARSSWGTALVFGPPPVDEAIAAIQAQVDRSPGMATNLGASGGMARLRALQGRFAEARELLARARIGFEELGDHHRLVGLRGTEGEIEHDAGDRESGARLSLEAYEAMTASGDRSFASTIAVELAEALFDLGDFEEAWRYGAIARDTSSSDDVMSQAGGRAVQARVLSGRGEHEAAETLAREAESIMSATDYIVLRGEMAEHLAHVLHEAGKTDEALAAARQAMELYDRKGATFLVERAQNLVRQWGGAAG